MKSKITRILSTALIAMSLSAVPASANTWIPDQGYTCWSYEFDDGTLATGWQLIDGKWYHFDEVPDYENHKNYCHRPGFYYEGDKTYYFKEDFSMAQNEWIPWSYRNGYSEAWADSTGNIDPSTIRHYSVS